MEPQFGMLRVGATPRNGGQSINVASSERSLITPAIFNIPSQQLDALAERIQNLELKIDALIQSLHSEQTLGSYSSPDEEALKRAVKEYFEERHGEDIYPDAIADEFGIDLVRAVELCELLVAEKKIERRNV